MMGTSCKEAMIVGETTVSADPRVVGVIAHLGAYIIHK